MAKLGQHFLKNEPVLHKIAQEATRSSASTIIEIGPGHGELTEKLRGASHKVRAGMDPTHIIAIEKDPSLVKFLQEKYVSEKSIEIIAGDIRKVLPLIGSHLASRTSYAITGNIPYYLTGYLFRLIGELEEKPEVCVFTIQKEVAERLVAKPPSMNRLAAAVQYWADAKILFHVERADFSPPPKVDSAVVRLVPKSSTDKKSAKRYYAFIQSLFSAPRKTILNNLSGKMALAERLKLDNEIRSLAVDPALRPQNLNIKDIEKLSMLLPLLEGPLRQSLSEARESEGERLPSPPPLKKGRRHTH